MKRKAQSSKPKVVRVLRKAAPRTEELATAGWGRIEAPTTPLGDLSLEAFPEDIQEQHARCTVFADSPGHWFVREAVRLNATFANYGLTLRTKDAKAGTADAWLDGAPDKAHPYRTRRRLLTRFIAEAWRHRFVYTDTVALWWTSAAGDLGEPLPQLILPEECAYKDAWGQEQLTWTAAGDNASGAPDAWKTRPDKNVIKEEADDFGFSVFKRGAPGHGFDTPEMAGIFGPLFQCESMEASEGTLALASRQVVRLHQLGHEQRYGQLAGNTTGNTKDRRKELKAALESRTGLVDLAGAYDHLIQYVLPDPKHYDARKWGSVVERMLWWAGPLGHLAILRGTSPYLMWSARVRHADERREFGAWLEEVIAECTGHEVTLKWSNRCYTDPRIAAEQARFAQSTGILSQGGYADDAGFDDDEELARKRKEKAELEDRLPLYDGPHGLVLGKPLEKPAAPSKGAKGLSGDSTGGGRPAGT